MLRVGFESSQRAPSLQQHATFCHLSPNGTDNVLTLVCNMELVLLLVLTEVLTPVSPMPGNQLGCTDDTQNVCESP